MSKNTLRFPESAIAGGKFGTARVSANPIARAAAGIVPVAGKPAARRKYGNTPTVVDGITFDSKREAARYSILAARLKAGEITNLRIQVPFVIVPAARICGKPVRERRYIADFVYDLLDGSMVVEDSKGMQTQMYRLKRQLMKVVHNIEVREV